MSEEDILCSFCGRTKSQTKILIAGLNAHICDICISQADMILKDDETSKESSDFSVDLEPPKEIKKFLDLHVIGQEQAKKTLAVAAPMPLPAPVMIMVLLIVSSSCVKEEVKSVLMLLSSNYFTQEVNCRSIGHVTLFGVVDVFG